jgi:quercetin dioxygenase-like cupin family protein
MSIKKKPKTKGIIPVIFNHYKALPSFYNFENSKIEVMSDKVSRQYLMGAQTMIVKWIFKKGAEIPLHYHPNEQITWITKGAVKVMSQGKTFTVKAGQVIIFPAYVPHEFLALRDTIDIDFFSPVRSDWLSNTADYLKKVEK